MIWVAVFAFFVFLFGFALIAFALVNKRRLIGHKIVPVVWNLITGDDDKLGKVKETLPKPVKEPNWGRINCRKYRQALSTRGSHGHFLSHSARYARQQAYKRTQFGSTRRARQKNTSDMSLA
jgi:hypothetical protein